MNDRMRRKARNIFDWRKFELKKVEIYFIEEKGGIKLSERKTVILRLIHYIVCAVA